MSLSDAISVLGWIALGWQLHGLVLDEVRRRRHRRPVRPRASRTTAAPISRARIYYGRTGETRPVMRLVYRQGGYQA